MTLVDTVYVIEAQYATMIPSEQMRQKEGKIVANHLTLLVDPDLFTDNADFAPAPKFVFGAGILA
jgi:hypothetical protein